MVSDAVVRSPEDLRALLIAEQVSMLSQTPSAFYALQTVDAQHPDRAQRLALQTVVFGGEALEPNGLGRGWMAIRACRGWSTCMGSPRRRCMPRFGK
ncbi:linear gramicidin synthetase subunit D domain protein [Mycobacterium xenopi 4042]|uniref:Linear gramicidin synthetase subunit D domain protein n=1 Tax=Mycobacterium xenopi 4042 TaxID=1299334 RepID=X8CLC5_MYCXE|nr:linear gramicidin synthetase subunit D domain protein [Mycobacterium xenopi 4042]